MRIGVYDEPFINIDNIVTEKPFLYGHILEETNIKLKNNDFKSFAFVHSFTNRGFLYTLKKIVDKNRYIVSFSEVNKEREEKMIKQVCATNEIIMLLSSNTMK